MEAGNIGLSWSPGIYDGGSPLIDYKITYHAEDYPYVVLASGITTKSYNITGLTKNVLYSF